MRGLYAITPESLDSTDLRRRVASALEGGIALLQYRRKARANLAEARELARMCRAHGTRFVVNDDLELALACGADGIHLGRDDGTLARARERAAGMLLGASCYNDLEAGRAAVAAGADYIAFGSVFASPTKPHAVRAPLSLFRDARALGVPVAAIGGITLENAPLAIEAGARLLAVISDLFEADDIAGRARAYGKLFP